MINQTLRMALASTWRSTGSDRLRCVVVTVAAAVLTVLAVGALSTWSSSGRINERVATRNFAAASSTDTVAYERTVSYDEAPNGAGILVAQWRIHPGNPPLAGIPTDATGWFVSPRLAELISTHPSLRITYSNASTIGADGVGRADELVAFEMLPPGGEPLNEAMTSTPFGYLGDSAELELLPIVVVVIGLLGIPGMSLLKAAVGVSSPKRERTAQLLFTLGSPKRSVRRYALLTGIFAALPGALVGAALWTLISPRLTVIPIVGRPVLAGDLAVHPAAALGIALIVSVLAGLVSRVRVQSVRSGDNAQRATRLRLPGPAWGVIGASTCMVAAVASGGIRPRLFLIGTVILIAGLPGTMRAMLHAFGALLARCLPHRPIALITGRVLDSDTKRVTQPLIAMMAVITVLPVMMSWVGVARIVDPVSMGNGAYTFSLTGEDNTAAAADYATQTGKSVVSVDYSELTGEPSTAVVTNCAALAALFDGATCGARAVALEPSRGVVPPLGIPTAELTTPEGFRADVSLIFATDLDTTERLLRRLATDYPDVSLRVPDQSSESPLVAWIFGAAALTLIVSGLGLVVALVAQASQAARQRTRLAALGTPRTFIQQLAAAEVAIAILAATGISLAAGLFLVAIFNKIEPIAQVPLIGTGLILVAGALIGLITAAAAAVSVGQPSNVWSERSHTGW